MKDIKVKLELIRPAKGKGGDRYEGYIKGEEKPLVIYLPQHISRTANVTKPSITLTIGD